jgi:RNA polymerase sigma-70 factor (ECF subfamily)
MFKAARINGVKAERATAFDALAQEQLDLAYRTATLILRDPVEAEDAAHDALVIAWRQWSTLRDPAKADAWFGRILAHVCLQRLRRRRRRPVTDISAEIEGSVAAEAPRDLPTAVADRDALNRAFARLSPEHRIAVVLRYYADLTVDQIADRTGVPSGTVKSRLHRALRDLGVTLEDPDREVLR